MPIKTSATPELEGYDVINNIYSTIVYRLCLVSLKFANLLDSGYTVKTLSP